VDGADIGYSFEGTSRLNSQKRVAVVISSTRTNRICGNIAGWVARVAQLDSLPRYELVDLAEVNLPFLDKAADTSTRTLRA
jgi:NAD(P)H-dependent FMN reductase